MSATPGARRPLTSRDSRWARWLAARLIARRVTPNVISAGSIVFALLAGVALWQHAGGGWGRAAVCLVVAATGIQLRLLCNMLDGMVAVEGGLKSATGELWNELPDRIADALILIGAGYGLRGLPHGPALGWAAALGAVLTAYVRALGQVAGAPAYFVGPMAKPHRMALLTVASLLAAALWPLGYGDRLLVSALLLVLAGTVLTSARRILLITRSLKQR